jgi:hypothetical protein
MEKMLIITNFSFSEISGGATALFLRRAETLMEEKGIVTYCVTSTNAFDDDFSYFHSKKITKKGEIEGTFLDLRPEYVLFFGSISFKYARKIRKIGEKNHINCEYLIDIQGCPEEGTDYSRSLLARAKLIVKKALTKQISRWVDGAFVASKNLIDYAKKYYFVSRKRNPKFYLCRCGMLSLPDFGSIKSNRVEFREENFIPQDSIVFCYAGYTEAWQRFWDIVGLFKKYDETVRNAYFAFFCPATEKEKNDIMANFPKGNCIVKLLKRETFKIGLDACDVGVLLRDYNTTNAVAFPNKFSDYLSSGLLIAINNALPEQVTLLKDYGLPFIDSEKMMGVGEVKVLEDVLTNKDAYLAKCKKLCREELLYSFQVKKLDL